MNSPGSKSPPADGGVTVVIPVRDEAPTIAATLDSLAAQSVGPRSLEVLVYDGMSGDGTAEIARSFAQRAAWRRFEVFENPARTVPHALNAGLAASLCRRFIRLDGRVRLSAGYIAECVSELERSSPRSAVGGRLVAEAEGPVPNAIAAAVTHPLGVGRGFRNLQEGSVVEIPHHPFAVWCTDDVRMLGGFKAELTRNQDDEFSMRAARGGFRILLTPAAEVVYRPRERLRGLAVQYFQYGLWKSAVARWHGFFPMRSAVPAALVLAVAAAAFSAASGRSRWPAISLCGLYAALGVTGSRAHPSANSLPTGGALATLHLAYGAGVIVGVVRPELTSTALGRARIR